MNQKLQISSDLLFSKMIDIAGEATKAANDAVVLTRVNAQHIDDINRRLESVDNNSRQRDLESKEFLAREIHHATDHIKAYLAQELGSFRTGMHDKVDAAIMGPKKVTDFISNAWVIAVFSCVFIVGLVGFIVEIKNLV